MITVSLVGGLGNQMFQYAAGKALAERHGVGLALDLSGFRNYPLRSFLLDRLCVPEADLAIASEAGRPDGNFVRSRWKQRIESTLDHPKLPLVDEATAAEKNARARELIWGALTGCVAESLVH